MKLLKNLIILAAWIVLLYVTAAMPSAHMKYITVPEGFVFLTLLPIAFVQFSRFYVGIINNKSI